MNKTKMTISDWQDVLEKVGNNRGGEYFSTDNDGSMYIYRKTDPDYVVRIQYGKPPVKLLKWCVEDFKVYKSTQLPTREDIGAYDYKYFSPYQYMTYGYLEFKNKKALNNPKQMYEVMSDTFAYIVEEEFEAKYSPSEYTTKTPHIIGNSSWYRGTTQAFSYKDVNGIEVQLMSIGKLVKKNKDRSNCNLTNLPFSPEYEDSNCIYVATKKLFSSEDEKIDSSIWYAKSSDSIYNLLNTYINEIAVDLFCIEYHNIVSRYICA